MMTRFERDGAVGRIIPANPPFNRIDFALCRGFARRSASGERKRDIRVLVVQWEGPHFSLAAKCAEWLGKDVNRFRTFVEVCKRLLSRSNCWKIPSAGIAVR